jgi:hypothetical protein
VAANVATGDDDDKRAFSTDFVFSLIIKLNQKKRKKETIFPLCILLLSSSPRAVRTEPCLVTITRLI